MIKTGRLVSCAIVAAMLLLAGALMVFAADQPPDTVAIKATLWGTAHTKPPVQLSHKKHVEEYKVTCAECHHKYEGGKNVWKEGDPVQKCEACHTEPTIAGEKKLSPEQQKLNLKLAFHGNCQECHKAAKKTNPETKAPVVCTGCHVK